MLPVITMGLIGLVFGVEKLDFAIKFKVLCLNLADHSMRPHSNIIDQSFSNCYFVV